MGHLHLRRFPRLYLDLSLVLRRQQHRRPRLRRHHRRPTTWPLLTQLWVTRSRYLPVFPSAVQVVACWHLLTQVPATNLSSSCPPSMNLFQMKTSVKQKNRTIFQVLIELCVQRMRDRVFKAITPSLAVVSPFQHLRRRFQTVQFSVQYLSPTFPFSESCHWPPPPTLVR